MGIFINVCTGSNTVLNEFSNYYYARHLISVFPKQTLLLGQMTNRELLKEAIADAKAVKEVAIANAKAVLVETFTPHLQSMYRKTLAEMEDEEMTEASMEAEEMYEEEPMHGEEDMIDLEELLRELEAGESETLYEAEGEEEEEKEEEEDEEKGEEKEEEGEETEIDFDNMTEEDLKSFIEEVIDEMIEAGEIEGGHPGMEDEMGAEKPEMETEMDFEMPEEETDLAEGSTKVAPPKTKPGTKVAPRRSIPSHAPKTRPAKAMAESKTNVELKQAMKVIENLRTELNEVNLLNSKLLYTSKILKEKNLTEAQKIQVLAAFDKAETVKETKLVYETLLEGLSKINTPKKNFLKESRGFASKPVGAPRTKPVVEIDPVIERFQKLAGIK